MSIDDAAHRPHAVYTGEPPKLDIAYGPEALRVTLDSWGPQDDLFLTLYDALQSNWGSRPSRTVRRGDTHAHTVDCDWRCRTGWAKLTQEEQAYVDRAFAGGTLGQVLEGITFYFTIEGCTRASTHQIVRTRIGAGFMQHGGRDNDWRHQGWTMPETIRRACAVLSGADGSSEEVEHCLTDVGVLKCLVYDTNATRPHGVNNLHGIIEDYLRWGKELYAALVDAGIPWQDARRLLPIGTQTYIHAVYNYPALSGVLANRLEHIMDWEINCIAQLMLREVRMQCPPLLGKYLGSHSDRQGRAAFAGLDSWPPDGKYPNPHERCRVCGHASADHEEDDHDMPVCRVCEREKTRKPYHPYAPGDSRTRTHRPEQNPFWVLHPSSLAGSPVRWIPTTGTYPHDPT
jgi:thymidylate synthase ThyX